MCVCVCVFCVGTAVLRCARHSGAQDCAQAPRHGQHSDCTGCDGGLPHPHRSPKVLPDLCTCSRAYLMSFMSCHVMQASCWALPSSLLWHFCGRCLYRCVHGRGEWSVTLWALPVCVCALPVCVCARRGRVVGDGHGSFTWPAACPLVAVQCCRAGPCQRRPLP